MSDNRENIKQKKRILEQGFLNGFDVYRALEAGINNILPYQDKLDEINVFPVPDGDTGTNMCFTLLPIVELPAKPTCPAIIQFLPICTLWATWT